MWFGSSRNVWFGTRRAALLFQECEKQAMVKIGFTTGQLVVRTFFHSSWLVHATVHGLVMLQWRNNVVRGPVFRTLICAEVVARVEKVVVFSGES